MELLGNNREVARNKLILLYIIEKVEVSMTNLQMTRLVTEKNIMNYFLLQQFLNELCESGFLSTNQADGKTFYTITQAGRQTLGYLFNLIPAGIKAKVDNTLIQIRRNVRNETRITADYKPENENEYIVSCKVAEDNFLIIDVKVTVGAKKDARILCDNWTKHCSEIYPEIIESLTRIRDQGNEKG